MKKHALASVNEIKEPIVEADLASVKDDVVMADELQPKINAADVKDNEKILPSFLGQHRKRRRFDDEDEKEDAIEIKLDQHQVKSENKPERNVIEVKSMQSSPEAVAIKDQTSVEVLGQAKPDSTP